MKAAQKPLACVATPKFVMGPFVTNENVPLPATGVPPIGPEAMMMRFSESSHCTPGGTSR